MSQMNKHSRYTYRKYAHRLEGRRHDFLPPHFSMTSFSINTLGDRQLPLRREPAPLPRAAFVRCAAASVCPKHVPLTVPQSAKITPSIVDSGPNAWQPISIKRFSGIVAQESDTLPASGTGGGGGVHSTSTASCRSVTPSQESVSRGNTVRSAFTWQLFFPKQAASNFAWDSGAWQLRLAKLDLPHCPPSQVPAGAP
jgi:hypothetical protein